MKSELDQLIARAEEFHGHAGPFLLLGIRLGLIAVEKLGADGRMKKLTAEVHCPLRTPYSCMLDGIQVSTGCTLGKRNLREVEDKKIWVKFSTVDRELKISLNPNFDLQKFAEGTWGEIHTRASEFLKIPDEEIFVLEGLGESQC